MVLTLSLMATSSALTCCTSLASRVGRGSFPWTEGRGGEGRGGEGRGGEGRGGEGRGGEGRGGEGGEGRGGVGRGKEKAVETRRVGRGLE